MRNCGIVIFIFLIGCKVAPPASTPTYKEDLSVHRPKIEMVAEQNSETNQEILTEEFIPLTGGIKAELDSIVKISLEENKERKLVDGFFIQVYNGNNREQARKIRNEVAGFYPDLTPKVSYHQPNFRVKAGQFTDRLKAYRIYQEIKVGFPKALLVPDRFVMKYD